MGITDTLQAKEPKPSKKLTSLKVKARQKLPIEDHSGPLVLKRYFGNTFVQSLANGNALNAQHLPKGKFVPDKKQAQKIDHDDSSQSTSEDHEDGSAVTAQTSDPNTAEEARDGNANVQPIEAKAPKTDAQSEKSLKRTAYRLRKYRKHVKDISRTAQTLGRKNPLTRAEMKRLRRIYRKMPRWGKKNRDELARLIVQGQSLISDEDRRFVQLAADKVALSIRNETILASKEVLTVNRQFSQWVRLDDAALAPAQAIADLDILDLKDFRAAKKTGEGLISEAEYASFGTLLKTVREKSASDEMIKRTEAEAKAYEEREKKQKAARDRAFRNGPPEPVVPYATASIIGKSFGSKISAGQMEDLLKGNVKGFLRPINRVELRIKGKEEEALQRMATLFAMNNQVAIGVRKKKDVSQKDWAYIRFMMTEAKLQSQKNRAIRKDIRSSQAGALYDFATSRRHVELLKLLNKNKKLRADFHDLNHVARGDKEDMYNMRDFFMEKAIDAVTDKVLMVTLEIEFLLAGGWAIRAAKTAPWIIRGGIVASEGAGVVASANMLPEQIGSIAGNAYDAKTTLEYAGASRNFSNKVTAAAAIFSLASGVGTGLLSLRRIRQLERTGRLAVALDAPTIEAAEAYVKGVDRQARIQAGAALEKLGNTSRSVGGNIYRAMDKAATPPKQVAERSAPTGGKISEPKAGTRRPTSKDERSGGGSKIAKQKKKDIQDPGGKVKRSQPGDKDADPNVYEVREFLNNVDRFGNDEARYFVKFELDKDGMMGGDMILRRNDVPGEKGFHRSSQLTGRKEFNRALEYFKQTKGEGSVKGIKGDWGSGDNLDIFNTEFQANLAKGLDREEAMKAAALKTHTGRWAQDAGFGEVVIKPKSGGPNGPFDEVHATFPPSSRATNTSPSKALPPGGSKGAGQPGLPNLPKGGNGTNPPMGGNRRTSTRADTVPYPAEAARTRPVKPPGPQDFPPGHQPPRGRRASSRADTVPYPAEAARTRPVKPPGPQDFPPGHQPATRSPCQQSCRHRPVPRGGCSHATRQTARPAGFSDPGANPHAVAVPAVVPTPSHTLLRPLAHGPSNRPGPRIFHPDTNPHVDVAPALGPRPFHTPRRPFARGPSNRQARRIFRLATNRHAVAVPPAALNGMTRPTNHRANLCRASQPPIRRQHQSFDLPLGVPRKEAGSIG